MNYNFSAWELAFKRYFTERRKQRNIYFVIDTNFYTSGYWIEEDLSDINKRAYVYKDAEVISLKLRVKRAIRNSQLAPGSINSPMPTGLIL